MNASVYGRYFGPPPSGDTSGVIDTPLIQAVLATGLVILQSGIYYVNAPLQAALAGCMVRGAKGATTSVYDGDPPVTGTVIKAAAGWATGGLSTPAVLQIQADGIHVRDLWIDAANVSANVDGINDGAGHKAIGIRNVGVWSPTQRGYAMAGSAWHLEHCNAICAGGTGYYGNWTDSSFEECHAQGCGQSGTGSGWYISGAECKLTDCRADLCQDGFVTDAGTFGTYLDVIQFVNCSTQRNNHRGWKITNSSATGGSARAPVILANCVSDADGINGTLTTASGGSITGGTGGGGYAGLHVEGVNTVYISNFVQTAATRDVGGGCPAYGISTATIGSGPNAPTIIDLGKALLNGITGAINDAAPARQFCVGAGVQQYSGGIYQGTSSTLPTPIAPNSPGSVLADFEYAPSSQVQLIANSTTLAAWTTAATTVAAGSNGGTISNIAAWSSPSAGVLDVATTTGWPPSGTVSVVTSGTTAVVNYTGIAAGQLTGCTFVSGTGTVSTGGAVTLTSVTLSSGAFTYPPSGKVRVEVQANLQTSAASGKIYLSLGNHGSVTPVTNRWEDTDSSSTGTARSYVAKFNVSGTPGTAGNLDLLGAADSGHTSTLLAIGDTGATPSTSGGCPLRITVSAL